MDKTFLSKAEVSYLPQEQDAQLVASFPKLYRVRHTTAYGLSHGFKVSAGWFNLLWDLSAQLEASILQLPEQLQSEHHALQVKQKLGMLCFYMHGMTKGMNELICTAQALSMNTCEVCGKSGAEVYPPIKVSFMRGWKQMVCPEHFRARAEIDQWKEIQVPSKYVDPFKEHFWDKLR
jgi:hypothetical protein